MSPAIQPLLLAAWPAVTPAKAAVAPSQSRRAALEATLHQLARELGFQGGLYVHLGHALGGAGEALCAAPVRFVATAVSDRRLYLEEGALGCDPIAARAARAHTPFAWSTAASGGTEAQRQLHARLRGRGIHAGVTAPVQDYAAGPAFLSLYSGFCDEAERLARENGPGLAYMAGEFHERAKASLPAFGQDAEQLVLTAREIDCMRLAAMGWTSAQSAAALKVSSRTVEFHLQNVAAKLGAPNRIAAVAMAVSRGLITL